MPTRHWRFPVLDVGQLSVRRAVQEQVADAERMSNVLIWFVNRAALDAEKLRDSGSVAS